ncbi:hypothetical protein [Halioglobus sp. HI00S01]|uniref:hypothetical protein n=1 Tax=Halioglobus sp. HI00S01 TaxID=1822214 RepID=UPI0012E7A648|nr:hypothetical protein [Halioglobus sp. HI00S01]
MTHATLETWFLELRAAAELSYGFTILPEDQTDWQQYWLEGYSPVDALDEDQRSG